MLRQSGFFALNKKSESPSLTKIIPALDSQYEYIYTLNCIFMQRGAASSATFVLTKHDRHNIIRELVASASVTSQDELRRKLVRRGFDVTQATLSRDIHELRIFKGPNGYALPNGVSDDGYNDLPSIREVLSSFGLKVKQAQNQLVLVTTAGSAQPVALSIDHEDWDEVVGTIAGDDTVLIICPDHKRASQLRARLEEMID
jgi:transcriptional regulator of arginine metabolism